MPLNHFINVNKMVYYPDFSFFITGKGGAFSLRSKARSWGTYVISIFYFTLFLL